MTTLAEKRKDAIKTHESKVTTEIHDLVELAAAMRRVGLTQGAEEIERITSSLLYHLKVLKTDASVN